MSQQNMQNHKDADFENNKYEILPNCDKNELLGGECQKSQETEEAYEGKLTVCGFTLALRPGAMELSEIEQKLCSKIPEWHLNSSIKSEFQDDSNERDICDLSGAYGSGFYFDKRCSKPLTSTPCSSKNRVSFQLSEDCSSMNDSGYDGSPTSERESPIISRKRNLDVSRYAIQDSFEEDLSANLSLDLSNPRFCLLSRFDEPSETDSADELYSSSKSSSSLTHLTTDHSKQLASISEDKGNAGHVCPGGTKDLTFSTQNTGTAHISSKLTDVFHNLPQNSGIVHFFHENIEIFPISPEKSEPVFDLPRKLASRHLPEKNDSGFVEELSDLFDASLNISDLNAASILYANSPEFSLARKVISTKEYNDRLQTTLRHFAPPCLDRLIGRKMGLDKVDIISELYFRSITGVLSTIFNYLSDDDLQSMSDVSVRWKATVKCISFARYRKHRQRQRPSQCTEQIDRENSFIESNEHRLVTNAPEPLLQVQSILEVKISTKLIPNRTERFWQEASKLRNHESLRKCPHCRYPSRIDAAQERAWCSDSKCLYDFCTRCLAPFHSLQPCIGAKHKQSSTQEIKICSRQSKRNLRRL